MGKTIRGSDNGCNGLLKGLKERKNVKKKERDARLQNLNNMINSKGRRTILSGLRKVKGGKEVIGVTQLSWGKNTKGDRKLRGHRAGIDQPSPQEHSPSQLRLKPTKSEEKRTSPYRHVESGCRRVRQGPKTIVKRNEWAGHRNGDSNSDSEF